MSQKNEVPNLASSGGSEDSDGSKKEKLSQAQSQNTIDRALSRVPGVRRVLDLKPVSVNKNRRKLYHNLALPEELIDQRTGCSKEQYRTNKVRSTRYTPLKFIPKNLYFQFQNVANIYFLAIAILSAFPIFGVVSAGLAAVPIIAIVVVTAIRDAIEDWRRQILDRDLNNALTAILKNVENKNVHDSNISMWRKFKKSCSAFYRSVWHKLRRKSNAGDDLKSLYSEHKSPFGDHNANNPERPKFKRDYWKNVKVGQFVKIFADEEVPADVIVIACSGGDGECFIETKNLDGETNLKARHALNSTKDWTTAHEIAQASFWLDVEPANSNLNSFGYALHTGESSEPVTPSNFIPRGSTLRNSKWAIGYVVYTGDESKIILNAGETPSKRSRLTRDLNFYVITSFVLLLPLGFVAGVVNGVRIRTPHNTMHLFELGLPAGSAALSGFVTSIAAIILMQNLIPISLYISIEIVRTIQAFFIYSDVHMYDDVTDTPCTPRSWSISDDLGQIEFVFSDKTGTLTQNKMEFRKLLVNGKSYGLAFTEAMAGELKRNGEDVEAVREKMESEIHSEQVKMLELLQKSFKNPYARPGEVGIVSLDLAKDMDGASGAEQQRKIELLALSLALCNNVTTNMTEHSGLVYESQNPDEGALVSVARDIGFTLLHRDRKSVTVDVLGQEKTYSVLHDIAFSSARKRMTVILREDQSGRCFAFTKGADSAMSSRVNGGLDKNTEDILLDYANKALRSLVVAYKEIDQSEIENWLQRLQAASTQQDREARVDELYEEMENNFELLGATGVEDLLQPGVPDTIELLGKSGVKLWVLTGDKVETAISIGYACKLIDQRMELMVCKSCDDLRDNFLKMGLVLSDAAFETARANHKPAPETHALVIDGETLGEVLTDEVLSHQLALLGKHCKSVLCCRVSPSQKAAVVSLMKRIFDVTTLSVGDGANDIAMIQEADVGVGIVGVEGRQAAMSSDYAIGQFKFLQRLILVHGHWSYLRVAELAANLLYKNVVFSMTLFWYNCFTQMDMSYVFDYTYITLFNSVFTSIPVVIMGILDQDVPDYCCLAFPHLYAKGILRKAFTREKFAAYLLDGLYQSAVCFFFTYGVYASANFPNMSGQPANYAEALGVYAGTVAILACNAYVLINQQLWDIVSIIINIISSLLVFAWTGIYTQFTASTKFYKSANHTYGNLTFWANLVLALITALAPRIVFVMLRKTWFPEDVDIIREQLQMGALEDLKKSNRNDSTVSKSPEIGTQPEERRRSGESAYHTPYL